VLGAVLVAGDQAAADAAVVGVLPLVVEDVAVAVQALDDPRADRGLDPSQIGEVSARTSAARTFSAIAGQSSRSQPCSVMSG
jgi:hypothetical protein